MGFCIKSCWKNYIERASICDFGLIKLSCVVFGILLATLCPPLIEFSPWLLAVVVVILAIKPTLTLLKNSERSRRI